MERLRIGGPPRTVGQAAEELNVSVGTIRAWLAQRRIGCVRLGRAVRIPGSEIARLLEAGFVPAVLDRPVPVAHRRVPALTKGSSR